MLLDRSRIVARQECPMLRYLSYHWDKTGLAPIQGSLALDVGIALHKGIECLFRGMGLKEALVAAEDCVTKALADAPPFYLAEQLCLVRSLLIGWEGVRLPAILDEYEVVSTEKEFIVKLSEEFDLMLRLDALLKRKDDGLHVIWDAKSLGYVSDDWMKVHEHSLQTILYTWAVQQELQEPVAIAYEGLTKGIRRVETAKASPYYGQKLQNSPFCYAYNLSGTTNFRVDYTSMKGWGKVAIWKHIPAEEWVSRLGKEDRLNALYPVIPPILPLLADQLRLKAQIVRGEHEFAARLDSLRANLNPKSLRLGPDEDPNRFRVDTEGRLFEQYRGRCYKFGTDNKCAFADYCYNSTVAEDPIETGAYVRRVPHHETEVAAWEDEE